jgi:hypothetical protein
MGKPLATHHAMEKVETLKSRVATDPSATPDLAEAMLELSQAYEAGDETRRACEAAYAGVRLLAPLYLGSPSSHHEVMDGLVSQYLSLAHRSKTTVDRALIDEIARAAGRLEQEDDE